MKLFRRMGLCLTILLFLTTLLRLDSLGGWYAAKALAHGKGSLWHTIAPGDERNPEWLKSALEEPAPNSRPGTFPMWRVVDGYEMGELPVMIDDRLVDNILIMKFSPKIFELSVNVDPHGGKQVGEWLRELHAVAVVNGSYYGVHREPATPSISYGRKMGPKYYEATHGAFVSRVEGAEIVNLKNRDWRSEFEGADQAFVSYPLLVSEGKAVPSEANPRWLANRSFIGIDKKGEIVLGTTTTGFFSLPHLAEFLAKSPLDLTMALNLDGGPVACQALEAGGFTREFCGQWEVITRNGTYQSLEPIVPGAQWDLPIALAVHRRTSS